MRLSRLLLVYNINFSRHEPTVTALTVIVSYLSVRFNFLRHSFATFAPQLSYLATPGCRRVLDDVIDDVVAAQDGGCVAAEQREAEPGAAAGVAATQGNQQLLLSHGRQARSHQHATRRAFPLHITLGTCIHDKKG